MSRKWYTADFHLFHDNIVRYTHRPFRKNCPTCGGDGCDKCRGTGWIPDIWTMHDAIVDAMTSRVAKNDELYILGDVAMYGGDKVRKVLERINGRKHLIIGNHDAKNMGNWEGWTSVNHYLEIKDRGQNVVLMHYPIESWNKCHYGAIHLHGHRHGTGKLHSGLREDVGVDCFDFKPVDLDILTEKWLKEGRLV